MIGNKEKCEYSEDEDEPVASSSSKYNQITGDTKLQRILKTLLIDLSFVAVVSKNLVQNLIIPHCLINRHIHCYTDNIPFIISKIICFKM